MTEIQRRLEILEKLQVTYPKAHIMLTYSNAWELLVAVVLSAQCTDKMVNTVTPHVFRRFKTIGDMATAEKKDVETLIKQTGFYKNKAEHIIEAAKRIIKVYHGHVPDTMNALQTLPGVARKTANVVLVNAFGKAEGIAVDTHVIRLSQRLRLVDIHAIGGKQIRYINANQKTVDFIKDADPKKIELQLMSWIPKTTWGSTTYQLIDHGRAVCRAIHPTCASCLLALLCPTKRGEY